MADVADNATSDAQAQKEEQERKIEVGSYKRSDGTKVSQYKRTAPSDESAASGKKKGQETAAPEKGGGKKSSGTAAAAEPGPPKKPSMSVDEYLAQPWVDKIRQQIGQDKEAAGLVQKDTARAKHHAEQNAAILKEQQGEPGSKGGYKEFHSALVKTLESRGFTNENGMAILKQLENGDYHDEGPMQKRSLVPHLGMAGLEELAKDVMNQKYTF